MAILKLANELGGTLRAEDVNTRLLGRPQESPHGQGILATIETYGLLEKAYGNDELYQLTEAGIDNLRKDQIMVPEEGAYNLYVTEDPLLTEAILKIERDTAVEKDESQSFFGKRNYSNLEHVKEKVQKPDCLNKYIHGYLLRQIADANSPIQINSISDKIARSYKKLDATISIEIAPNSNPIMKVTTGLGKIRSEVHGETRFDKSYFQVLERLVSGIGKLDVIDNEPNLLLSWEKVNPQEAEKFRKQITLSNFTLWEFGPFQTTSFSIPIFPVSKDDAINWANHLLRQNITTYTDKSEYETKKLETISKFKNKYGELASTLTDYDELLDEVIEERKAGKQPILYWRLITPQDLTSR